VPASCFASATCATTTLGCAWPGLAAQLALMLLGRSAGVYPSPRFPVPDSPAALPRDNLIHRPGWG
jgi:hypothetical protein